MHHPILLCLVLGLGLCVVGACLQPVSVPDRTRIALLDVFAKHHLTQKDICALLGYSQSQWSKIARGEKYYRLPPVDRLIECLPVEVLMDYLPELGKITLERYLDEGAADVRELRSA